MKLLVVVLLVIAVNCLSVSSHRCEYSAEECSSYKYTVEQIDTLMEKEAKYHKFNLDYYGGDNYLSRAQYILTSLNSKLSNSYSRNQYPAGTRRTSGNDLGCKELENAILAKSKQFGIEKIGLESNVERLKKVLNHQDQRNQFQDELLEKATNETQSCVLRTTEQDNAIESSNAKREEQAKKIKELEEIIKSRDKEIKKLQTKLNANAPSIHGGTGQIFPEVSSSTPTIEANNLTSTTTSTPEVAAPAASINATDTGSEEDNTAAAPEIDLRNDNRNN